MPFSLQAAMSLLFSNSWGESSSLYSNMINFFMNLVLISLYHVSVFSSLMYASAIVPSGIKINDAAKARGWLCSSSYIR